MIIFRQALEDFDKLIEIDDFDIKPHYYKAKVLERLGNLDDAVLSFEQVIKLCEGTTTIAQVDDTSISGLQSNALKEIIKIRVRQRDFYEAYYALQRADKSRLKLPKLALYQGFTEGVIFLMKRKTKKGVALLTQMIEKSPALAEEPFLDPLIYVYRAYGRIVLQEYDLALKDLLKASGVRKLSAAGHYNLHLCVGILSVRNKEFDAAKQYFAKAQAKFPDNRNQFLQAVAIIKQANESNQKPEKRLKMAKDAKKIVDAVLKKHKKDYSVMYYRGLLNLYLQCFNNAINDFNTVIDNDEDTAAKYYLGRGRCYACLSMFKEAITDLSIAINIDKDLIDAYLNRGKCAYLIGDTSLAFMDFQKIIVLQPKNPMVHVYAGNLLMTTGSYEDATKAFTNADNIKKSSLALYQRSRCFVALTKTKEALADLNKVVELSPNDKVARNDRDCLK